MSALPPITTKKADIGYVGFVPKPSPFVPGLSHFCDAADAGDRARAHGAPTLLLLLDELSIGIAQRLKVEIFNSIRAIQRAGTRSTLAIADQVYVLEHGRVDRHGNARELADDDEIRRIYLGV
jgi:hypothetical protein